MTSPLRVPPCDVIRSVSVLLLEPHHYSLLVSFKFTWGVSKLQYKIFRKFCYVYIDFLQSMVDQVQGTTLQDDSVVKEPLRLCAHVLQQVHILLVGVLL